MNNQIATQQKVVSNNVRRHNVIISQIGCGPIPGSDRLQVIWNHIEKLTDRYKVLKAHNETKCGPEIAKLSKEIDVLGSQYAKICL